MSRFAGNVAFVTGASPELRYVEPTVAPRARATTLRLVPRSEAGA
jgi:hypothetical protein